MTKLHQSIKLNLQPAEPLWQRVPTQDRQGQSLGDFMMLIPHFNAWSSIKQELAIVAIESELKRFSKQIVFADFNMKINILWISLRPQSGVMLAFVEALQQLLPEARLIASRAEIMMGVGSTRALKKQAKLR